MTPGHAQKIERKSPAANDPKLSLQQELKSNKSAIWDFIELLERYIELGGQAMRRSALINMVSQDMDDLVVLSAPGFRSIVLFRDNNKVTLKMIKYEEEDDDLESALNIVAKHIHGDCLNIKYDHRKYRTTISKQQADESVSDTLQQLLEKLAMSFDSLPTLLLGNIITSAVNKHPTPLGTEIQASLSCAEVFWYVQAGGESQKIRWSCSSYSW